jgi:hypothetical protein
MMVKVERGDLCYYFEDEYHLKTAVEHQTPFSYLQMCSIAVNRTENVIVKCRYSYETIIDKIMRAENKEKMNEDS